VLNPQQSAAVHYIDSPCLVLAGAGSGKTRVITEKIKHLIESRYCLPEKIYAVTFTNKAAKEMQTRLNKALLSKKKRPTLGISRANENDKPFIGTFHKLGIIILRNHATELGRKKHFSIFDDTDSNKLIQDLLPGIRSDDPMIRQIRWKISGWKSALMDPDTIMREVNNDIDATAGRIYQEYEDLLAQHQAFDFDDLIAKPVKLFQQNAEIKAQWQDKIRYLLVDEYQDTNGAQYALLQALIGDSQALTVVGDDDQSIYAWRGAQPENLLKMKDDFPNLKVIKLEQNYRSTNRILLSANKLIQNNPHLFEKRLWSDQGLGEKIKIQPARDAEDEAIQVVGAIQRLQIRDHKYGDMAILYRSNHQARAFEKQLRHFQIPYYLSGGTSYFDRTEVRDILSYLRVIANPDDNNALLRIINTPRRQIGKATLEALHKISADNNCSLYDACMHPSLNQALNKGSRQKLLAFSQLMRHLVDMSESGQILSCLDEMMERTGYMDWIQTQAKTPEEAQAKQELVSELLSWIGRILNKEKCDTLADVLTHLALVNTLENEDNDDKSNQVQLMTLHAAKGLEFPFVFLVGMEDGILPHHNSIDSGDIEEERRLAYVGITAFIGSEKQN